MQSLSSQEINCFNCEGICCSFQANSMQVTPLQTLDLYIFLQSENRWNLSLKKTLNEVIEYYRLSIEIQTHRSQQMRKTYTCPFYSPGGKGCSISPLYKPYGCLGFNPNRKNCIGQGGCGSNIEELSIREDEWGNIEQVTNDFIQKQLNLSWKKIDIPRALIDLFNREDRLSNEFFEDVTHQLEK